LDNLAA